MDWVAAWNNLVAGHNLVALAAVLQLLLNEELKWELLHWNLALGQQMNSIELQWKTRLALLWKNLDPCKTVSVLDHLSKMLPVKGRERCLDVDLLRLQLWLGKVKVSILLLLVGSWLDVLRGGLCSLFETVILNGEDLALFIHFFMMDEEELAINLWEWVSNQHVVGIVLDQDMGSGELE